VKGSIPLRFRKNPEILPLSNFEEIGEGRVGFEIIYKNLILRV
jgi:hypothetical protein